MTDVSDITGIPPVRRPLPEVDEVFTCSIEDLCAPLSARVMPQSMRYSSGGREMTERDQMRVQRKASLRGMFRRAGIKGIGG